MKKCIFPGTFNPFTIGHLDIARRASELFDEVTIGVFSESGKPSVLSVEKRIYLVEKCVSDIKNVKVRAFDGLLVDFCKKEKTDVIVRGIRSYNDFQYEGMLEYVNKQLLQNIETVYLFTLQQHSHISSSTVRELIQLDADITSFVPEAIKEDLLTLYKK